MKIRLRMTKELFAFGFEWSSAANRFWVLLGIFAIEFKWKDQYEG